MSNALPNSPAAIEVLYRDDAVVAVAKPAGRIVVPGRSGAAVEVSLRDQLAAQLGQRVFVVHRLDRGTSGVLIFALTADAHRALSMAFERHQADKRYWALCRGSLIGSGEVDRALVPIRGGKARVARDGETNGKSSRTAWRALERYVSFTRRRVPPAHRSPASGPLARGVSRVTRWRWIPTTAARIHCEYATSRARRRLATTPTRWWCPA